jgi:hypothetical protein
LYESLLVVRKDPCIFIWSSCTEAKSPPNEAPAENGSTTAATAIATANNILNLIFVKTFPGWGFLGKVPNKVYQSMMQDCAPALAGWKLIAEELQRPLNPHLWSSY